MSLDSVRSLIQNNNGDLSRFTVTITEIKTKQSLNEAIELLSTPSLQIDYLTIYVDKTLAEDFISRFTNINPKPQLNKLRLPDLELSDEGWQNFFAKLPDFASLEHLDLDYSNLDYKKHLRYFGGYLAGNPALLAMSLCKKGVAEINNSMFKQDPWATELFGFLQNNTNLSRFRYGNRFDYAFKEQKLAFNVQKILDKNYSKISNRVNIANAVAEFREERYLQSARSALDGFFSECFAELLLPAHQQIFSEDADGLSRNSQTILFMLLRINGLLEWAGQDESFNQSSLHDELKNELAYYNLQYTLLMQLYEINNHCTTASENDRNSLRALNESILNPWKEALNIENIQERNRKMEELIRSAMSECTTAKSRVRDKTSTALIKNMLLILSSILTLGIALGIYAAVTTEARKERGSFFFKDAETSKPKIEKLESSLHSLETHINPGQNKH
ncbi:hypothetical protein [Legionella worsleiensis]|uniref:Uncharacterized protein n=1 Tax=Legionella worsleiensis TaxID=45076 RepID=A0A0W1A9E6_9GAMM|nr:hypothetical protein [Legionella worsleiensis]KTD77989.1 hypothetical protein Lwor_1871 [Legionella worsleiensis]STY31537.1 Uncharacterised protein [Legionella worsleiensis]